METEKVIQEKAVVEKDKPQPTGTFTRIDQPSFTGETVVPQPEKALTDTLR